MENDTKTETMRNSYDEKEVRKAFEDLVERLGSLDGMYAWDIEADIVRRALDDAGFS